MVTTSIYSTIRGPITVNSTHTEADRFCIRIGCADAFIYMDRRELAELVAEANKALIAEAEPQQVAA